VFSTRTTADVVVVPFVVPVCLTNIYVPVAAAGTIILLAPAVAAIIVDKLEAGDVTVKLSVTEKFIASLKLVESFIERVGINAMLFLFYYFLHRAIIIDVK
jgi:predicted transporter